MFSTLFTFVLCATALSTPSVAAPWPTTVQHVTHKTRSLPNGAKVGLYNPKSHFEIYERGVEHPLSRRSERAQFQDSGLAFLRSKLGDDDSIMAVQSSFTGAHSSHVYVRQRVAGIPVANAMANVALNEKGDVVSFSSNFVTASGFAAPSTTAKITADEAATAAAKALGGHYTGRVPELQFLATEDGNLALIHTVRLEIHGTDHLVEAYVDAETAEVRGMIDYTNDLTMRVVPVTKSDPTVAYELVKNPEDKNSSPQGWGIAENRNWHATIGNNAVAFKGNVSTDTIEQITAAAAPETAPGVFDYALDLNADPTTQVNLEAAKVNAWYVANVAHDILYRYGFTESAFNFQDSNFGKGGNDSDVVFISVQDGDGTDNANFSTPPDGEPGIMRMYLWDTTKPMRDGDLTNQIILHEYTHGLTNRLTGGGTAACLQTIESQGLGEGWSDAFADWVAQTQNGGHVPDYSIGGYVTGNMAKGIRSHPYSNNRAVNPLTYMNVPDSTEPHKIGEVWAQTLHVVHSALVHTLGSAPDALTNPDAVNGHTAFLHLMIDALSLQPCNPSFLDARLAWIQADANRFGGKNKCNLWLAFAYMGMGVDAKEYINGHKIPDGCPLTYSKVVF